MGRAIPSTAASLLTFLCLGSGLGQAAAAEAFPGTDTPWRHFRSPHCELYSANSEAESRLLLHNMELARALAIDGFKLPVRREIPFTVYFFSRDKHFDYYRPERLKHRQRLSAVYHGDADRGVLLMVPTPDFDAAQRLGFGCNLSHSIRLTEEHPPYWLSSGLRQIFDILESHSDALTVGKPHPGTVVLLRRSKLPRVSQLLAEGHREDASLSDDEVALRSAASWLFVHYLYFGPHGIPVSRIQQFVRFSLEQGRRFDPEASRRKFEELLGMDYAAMDRALSGYVLHGRFASGSLHVPPVPDKASFASRMVPPEEIWERLAELAVRTNESPEGKLMVEEASGRPGSARALEVLGTLALRQGNRELAEARWQQAVAAGGANPAVLHQLAAFFRQRRLAGFNPEFRLPDGETAQIRTILDLSIRAVPEQSFAYETLAWVEAYAGEPDPRNVNVVQRRFPLLRDQPRTLLALALMRQHIGDLASAREILDELGHLQADEWTAQGARQLSRLLDSHSPAGQTQAAVPSPQPASR